MTRQASLRPDMNKYEAEHDYDLDPWHPLIHLALARLEQETADRRECVQAKRAPAPENGDDAIVVVENVGTSDGRGRALT